MSEEQNPTIDERLAALTMNVELTAASVHDLAATVRAMVERDSERRERDRTYLNALADLLRHWGNGREGV